MENLKQQFKNLHEQLVKLSNVDTAQLDHLLIQQKIVRYIEIIALAQKNYDLSAQYFDYFCQNNGSSMLESLFKIDRMISINCLSLFFINIGNDLWVNYFLFQPFVLKAIDLEQPIKSEQQSEYYISFLKSLSIRIQSEQLSLFYNQKTPHFPLIYQTIKYLHFPDLIGKTNIMNIVLGIMKIPHDKTPIYFSTFPFTMYIYSFCLDIVKNCNTIIKKATIEKQTLNRNQSKTFVGDLYDDLCYMNDLIMFGGMKLRIFIFNTIAHIIIFPLILSLQDQTEQGKKIIFLVMFNIIKSLKYPQLVELLQRILLKNILSLQLTENIKKSRQQLQQVMSFSQFSHDNFFWDQFLPEIKIYCKKQLTNSLNGKVDNETDQSSQKKLKEFLLPISNSLGIDILTGEAIRRSLFQMTENQIKLNIKDNNQNQNCYFISPQFFTSTISIQKEEIFQTLSSLIFSLKEISFNTDYTFNNSKECIDYISHFSIQKNTLKGLTNVLKIYQNSPVQYHQINFIWIIKAFKKYSEQLLQQIYKEDPYKFFLLFKQHFLKSIQDVLSLEQKIPYNVLLLSSQQKSKCYDLSLMYKIPMNEKQQIMNTLTTFSIFYIFYISNNLVNEKIKRKLSFYDAYRQHFRRDSSSLRIDDIVNLSEYNKRSCKRVNPQKKSFFSSGMQDIFQLQSEFNFILAVPNRDKASAIIIANVQWSNIQVEVCQKDNKKLLITMKIQNLGNVKRQQIQLFFKTVSECKIARLWIQNIKQVYKNQQVNFLEQYLKNITEHLKTAMLEYDTK